MESKDNFLPDNFLIIVDKNKINHPAPLPNFSQLKKMTINFSSQLRKMNLPSFKDFYSCQGLVYNDNNEYLTNEEVIEKVSLLTVFGIKYKYLNRKKCFPTKLTNEQLKLKKAFVCLEIVKFNNTFTPENDNYEALEKINQHFEETWKESEYSIEDEYFIFAVLNLGRLYSEFDEKSKVEVLSNKMAKILECYLAKPEVFKLHSKCMNNCCSCNRMGVPSLEVLRDYMRSKLSVHEIKWVDKLAFKMNSVLSKIIINSDDDVALFDLQMAIKLYLKRRKKVQNSKFIQTFICNKMFPFRIEYKNACKARLDDATAKLNEETAKLKEETKVRDDYYAMHKDKEFYKKIKELHENVKKAQYKVNEAEDKLDEAHADFCEAITGMDDER